MKGLLLFVALLATGGLYAAEETINLEAPLKAGGTVKLDNTNGDVTIHAWDKDKVVLKAIKKSRNADALTQTKVTLHAAGDVVEIATKRPRSFWGGRNVSVTMEVWVPAKLLLNADVTNGSIQVENVQGDLHVETTNGDVTVLGAAGKVHAETTNGDLRADLVAGDSKGVDMETTNGSITLRLPGSIKGQVEANTTNGSINSELQMTVSKSSKKHLAGSLNGGGPKIELETTNGSISISKL